MKTTYGIRITSFRGISMGALHYYGHLWESNGKVKKTDILRIMTAEDAAMFNSLDDRETYRAGDQTHRWDDWRALFQAGVELARTTFGAVPLHVCDYVYEPEHIIYLQDTLTDAMLSDEDYEAAYREFLE